jgi:hypothetical protein
VSRVADWSASITFLSSGDASGPSAVAAAMRTSRSSFASFSFSTSIGITRRDSGWPARYTMARMAAFRVATFGAAA